MNPSKYFGITDQQSLVLLGEFGSEAEARASDEARTYSLTAVFGEETATGLLRKLHEFLKLEATLEGYGWFVVVDWTGKPWLLDEYPSWTIARHSIDESLEGHWSALLDRGHQWAWRRMLLATLDMAIMSPELMGQDAPPKRGRKGGKGPRQLSLH